VIQHRFKPYQVFVTEFTLRAEKTDKRSKHKEYDLRDYQAMFYPTDRYGANSRIGKLLRVVPFAAEFFKVERGFATRFHVGFETAEQAKILYDVVKAFTTAAYVVDSSNRHPEFVELLTPGLAGATVATLTGLPLSSLSAADGDSAEPSAPSLSAVKGTEEEVSSFCHSCGAKNAKMGKFCAECGTNLVK
jgi:hypothetical protein